MNIVISLIVWIFCSIIALLLFPVSLVIWLVTFPFDRERIVMHWWLVIQGIFFSRMIPIWRIRVEGREKAKKRETYVIISNHQSMLDILILNCLRLRFRWISKIENYKTPVIGWYLRMAKYITVDRGNMESKAVMMAKSEESLKKGISIMMFPEGTRSPDREIALFKLGAFQLALSASKPILPVIVDGTGGVLPKHGMILSKGNLLKIKVLDPVRPESFGTDDPEILASKLRGIMTEELHKIRNA
jgi:1-acyl-sn-glycerol-3-phosphate acyltransferase